MYIPDAYICTAEEKLRDDKVEEAFTKLSLSHSTHLHQHMLMRLHKPRWILFSWFWWIEFVSTENTYFCSFYMYCPKDNLLGQWLRNKGCLLTTGYSLREWGESPLTSRLCFTSPLTKVERSLLRPWFLGSKRKLYKWLNLLLWEQTRSFHLVR